MIHTLQSHKKIESLREEKEKVINDFKRVVREINLIVSKIKKRLPRTKLRALSKEDQLQVYNKAAQVQNKTEKSKNSKNSKNSKSKNQKETANEVPKVKDDQVLKKKENDFDRLQNQLDEIESKLKSI
jgi:hypothetical protein